MNKHYRIILSQLASQRRAILPTNLRKAPLNAELPKLKEKLTLKQFWSQMPWYLRTTIEGAGIVLMLLLAISVGPRVRQLYEREIEKSVSEYHDTFQETNPTDKGDAPPLMRKGVSTNEGGEEIASDEANSEEFGDENEVDSAEYSDADNEENIRVGSSEIWRFNLKTDSPRELRDKIVRILMDMKLPKELPGLGGIEAPGGVQFDILIPQSLVPKVKTQLQKLAPKTGASGDSFAWYKNKSRKVIPSGKTRVVIWLSQM